MGQLARILNLKDGIVITQASSDPNDDSIILYVRGDDLAPSEGKHYSQRIPLSELMYVDG